MRASSPASLLLSGLAAGDQRAFASLYDRLGTPMLRVAAAMLGADEAQDAVQDVFVGLAKSRERLLLVEDLDSYVFACLRNIVGQRLKRLKIEQLRLSEFAANASSGKTQPAGTDEDLEIALRKLPADQREVIALKVDGELTFAQIAQVLGVSPNTAASRYRYALEKLRRMMGK
ncbi:MAG TPA: sigma-70 family RNA polymerase sigma factor [Humisphaera sp.]|jgi:RNA polymerase sigma-70 factor (ECF subfamily)|nr:sigma-70 family RNA polymerase sigma factor [Humisphaera sp.]